MIFTPEAYHLLTAATQARADLPALARKAETLVVDRYRQPNDRSAAQGDGFAVKLRGWPIGYDGDDPAVLPDDLLERLQMAIAEMIEHLAKEDKDVKRVRRGDREVEYARTPGVPRSIRRLLAPYDLREAVYRI